LEEGNQGLTAMRPLPNKKDFVGTRGGGGGEKGQVAKNPSKKRRLPDPNHFVFEANDTFKQNPVLGEKKKNANFSGGKKEGKDNDKVVYPSRGKWVPDPVKGRNRRENAKGGARVRAAWQQGLRKREGATTFTRSPPQDEGGGGGADTVKKIEKKKLLEGKWGIHINKNWNACLPLQKKKKNNQPALNEGAGPETTASRRLVKEPEMRSRKKKNQ